MEYCSLIAQVSAAFENDALIFASSDAGPSWHKTSQCVWSTAARIRGKVSLNDDYEDLEELFVSFLGVQRVDLQMAVDALQEIGNRQSASNEEVRESIWTVNALLQVATDSTSYSSSEEIIKCCIFPVSNPNGIITRASNAMSFFIVDREPLEAYFTAKVKLLAFSLNEVVRLRPFLLWACLEDRFLSNCVKEITSFNGYAEKVSDPDREVRNRAYSLLRSAVVTVIMVVKSYADFFRQDCCSLSKPASQFNRGFRGHVQYATQRRDLRDRRHFFSSTSVPRWGFSQCGGPAD